MAKRKIVLVVDAGGRGATLVDKYARSPHVGKIFAVPGNDLMQINTDKPVEIYPQLKTTSVPEILGICQEEKVDLVDVAQDNAVAAGLVDALEERGMAVVGPRKLAGQIEWDKAWAREFGAKHGLPQPVFKICHSIKEGAEFIQSQPEQRWFIKASGLAEGKGALPAQNNKEGVKKIIELRKRFKEAGKVFLIEEWLAGEEFSTLAFSDGENLKVIGSAQDHKRVNNFDEGENTGGMGCSAPPLILTPKLIKKIETKILSKAIKGLQKEGRPYRGVLYLGGIIKEDNEQQNPCVLEFNARWGDPEVQVILPGLLNDLYEVSMAIVTGNIKNLKLKIDGKARVVVAGASKGYPRDYSAVKGKQIFGIEEARKIPGVKVFGAGVKRINGKDFVSGGRLFYIVGEGKTVIEARQKAYQAMSMVSIEGNNLHYRTDIGWRDVERLRRGK